MKIITRAEATAQGLPRYYTGKPCKYGHLSERLRASGACIECFTAYQKAYSQTEERKAAHRKTQQRYYQRTQQRAREVQKQEQQPGILKVISRADAQAQGLKRYYVGEKCKHGHLSERYTRGGACVECSHIKSRAHHKRNPHHASTTYTADAYPNAIVPLTPEEQEVLANVYRKAHGLTEWSGIRHHVDHCYPLALGGVHHPENLIVVPASVNKAKFNKADPAIPSVFFGFLVSFPYIEAGGAA